LVVVNYTLKTLYSTIQQELDKIPDGYEATQEVTTMKVIENILEKINK
jgi:hypothetical protein